MVLSLGSGAFAGAQPVAAFIGEGGALVDTNSDDNSATGTFKDDSVNTDAALGFYASLNSLTLITLKNDNQTPALTTDDTNYLGLEADGLTAKLVGIDGFTFGVYDGAVKVNQAKAGTDVTTAPSKIDWKTFDETDASLQVPTLDVTSGVDLSAQGSVAFNAFGALIAKGSFKLGLGTVQKQESPTGRLTRR